MQTILKLLLIYFLLGFNLAKADGHSSKKIGVFILERLILVMREKSLLYLVYSILILEKIKRAF